MILMLNSIWVYFIKMEMVSPKTSLKRIYTLKKLLERDFILPSMNWDFYICAAQAQKEISIKLKICLRKQHSKIAIQQWLTQECSIFMDLVLDRATLRQKNCSKKPLNITIMKLNFFWESFMNGGQVSKKMIRQPKNGMENPVTMVISLGVIPIDDYIFANKAA